MIRPSLACGDRTAAPAAILCAMTAGAASVDGASSDCWEHPGKIQAFLAVAAGTSLALTLENHQSVTSYDDCTRFSASACVAGGGTM